jgi:hypothetical protein
MYVFSKRVTIDNSIVPMKIKNNKNTPVTAQDSKVRVFSFRTPSTKTREYTDGKITVVHCVCCKQRKEVKKFEKGESPDLHAPSLNGWKKVKRESSGFGSLRFPNQSEIWFCPKQECTAQVSAILADESKIPKDYSPREEITRYSCKECGKRREYDELNRTIGGGPLLGGWCHLKRNSTSGVFDNHEDPIGNLSVNLCSLECLCKYAERIKITGEKAVEQP